MALIEELAIGSMSKDDQIALIARIEDSIRMKEEEQAVLDQAAEAIADRLNALEDYVDSKVQELKVIAKTPGPAGKDGRQGADGPRGLDGAPGRDGMNGRDGKDGKDGKDGVSIVDVYVAADGSLVCVLSDGREIDTGPLLEAGTGGNTSVTTNTWAGYSIEDLKQAFIAQTFETVSKNLASAGGTLAYDANGDLVTITYDNGILKTLAYDANGDLISLTLSGDTPEGIDLVKTFSYDANGDLVNFVYS